MRLKIGDKMTHPADVLINKDNIRESKKELIEIYSDLTTEREKVEKKAFRLKSPRDMQQIRSLLHRLEGLDFARGLIAERLNIDEQIEELKF